MVSDENKVYDSKGVVLQLSPVSVCNNQQRTVSMQCLLQANAQEMFLNINNRKYRTRRTKNKENTTCAVGGNHAAIMKKIHWL
jgi:hypothetical protein